MENAEAQARAILQRQEDFMQAVWDRGGIGKLFVVLFYLALLAPFVFDLVLVVVLIFLVLPSALTVTEKVAILALVFAALHAIALSAQRFAAQMWQYGLVMFGHKIIPTSEEKQP